MLDQLKREEAEELEKVQRHLEAAELAIRELENNVKLLQESNITLTEVELSQSKSINFVKFFFFCI